TTWTARRRRTPAYPAPGRTGRWDAKSPDGPTRTAPACAADRAYSGSARRKRRSLRRAQWQTRLRISSNSPHWPVAAQESPKHAITRAFDTTTKRIARNRHARSLGDHRRHGGQRAAGPGAGASDGRAGARAGPAAAQTMGVVRAARTARRAARARGARPRSFRAAVAEARDRLRTLAALL